MLLENLLHIKYGYDKIWIDESPVEQIRNEISHTHMASCEESKNSHTRTVVMELFIPRGAVPMYGMLGATVKPMKSGVKIQVMAQKLLITKVQMAQKSLGDVYHGLHEYYAPAIIKSAVDTMSRVERFPSVVTFNTAQCSDVCSSPSIFSALAKNIVTILYSKDVSEKHLKEIVSMS